ncbi:Hippurate hydrolase [Methylobacterium crusticola]|uniref:Hippurate hydrolase n=1 Tax=Methylobacterium crusticola TaxID=1697972 RepID=A0ABQ4R872_9HYPH|nr:M20 aminoacylase family protein [Methylobacterium crusticola]GJD53582.1 Hippurate hydrolase [Methylobacterium crusticola]
MTDIVTERSALRDALDTYKPELVEIRRTIHAHPEVGFEETRTAGLVAERLRAWGLEVSEGLGGTGVVATLTGTSSGNGSIGLRADMDALHIQETPGRLHGSAIPGKMHACGHDGHTTMLLGAARYLAEHRDSFAGDVVFIFQPAEEVLTGARRMIGEGLFEQHPVDAVYGMHNMPGLPAGEFHIRSGPFLAASDSWAVTFRGTGGHGGAGAHLAKDPTLSAAHFVLALQTIVSRNVPAIETAVVSVGSIEGGDPNSPNIIPTEVRLTGTARSYSASTRDLIERRLGEIADAQGLTFGCRSELDYRRLCPPLVGDADHVARSVAAASSLVGRGKVKTDPHLLTASEDFSFMLEARPGSFILIGNGVNQDGSFAPVHTPEYDFNDDILTLGAAYWVGLVQQELRPR